MIILRGNSGVSIASALNRYLKDYCHCDISWDCGNQLRLPAELPSVSKPMRVVSPYKFRYSYNYCTHGYTMAWWSWARWQRELDFLALSGVNLALVIEGQESVWINTFKQFGYTDAEVRQWLVLPTHQPWMYMGNIEGYGGPVPPSLVEQRRELGRKVVSRMRELGIEPVLQGYYGMVPPDFGNRHPNVRLFPPGTWHGKPLKRPDLMDPTDPLYAKVASTFYREQRQLFGRARFLAADPFHEGGDTTNVDLSACGRAIQNAMHGATWVLQSWESNPRQQMIAGLNPDQLLILDLWCEAKENWRTRSNFGGAPWLWCTIGNFGGNVGLAGRLAWSGEGPAQALHDPDKGRMSGIGALLEGSGTMPALWEMFFESAWRATAPELDSWLVDYARRRYGAKLPAAERAWRILAGTVYDNPASLTQYPVNSVVCARPSLNPEQRARPFVTTEPNYDTTRLVEAWKLLIDAAPQAKSSDGYLYDLADVGRQVLADLGTRYHREITGAYEAKDAATVRVYSEKMLGLIRDMDDLAGTRRELLLGVWLEDARRWGTTNEEKDRYERDARELLTVWTSGDVTPDYANRQWNGMLGGFYYHRWKMWFQALNQAVVTGGAINTTAVRDQIRDWELGWTRQHDLYPTQPQGDTVVLSRRLFEKYQADASAHTLKPAQAIPGKPRISSIP